MKKISIIIPCHNSTATLEQTFASLKAQTMSLSDLECIFVDDASDDGGKTWEKLIGFETQAPESVIIIRLEKNVRQGGARNVGMEYRSGEYLMFLDSDDTLRKDACEKLYAYAQTYGADLIKFKHRHVIEQSYVGGMPEQTTATGDALLYDLEKEEDVRRDLLTMAIDDCNSTSKFYRSDLVRQCGSVFAEGVVYEEPLFVYPLFLYAKKILIMDEAFYEYHWHENSTMTSLLGPRLLEHPKVQLNLLADLMKRTDSFRRYHQEIEYYFILTFYIETIVFAHVNRGNIPLEYMKYMQSVCKKTFPNAKENFYIIGNAALSEIVQSIENEFRDERELAVFEERAASLLC